MSDQGRFIWYELMTPDVAAAKAFYASVLGWSANDMPDMSYTVMNAGAAGVAGVMGLPDALRAQGVPPNWTGYVAVDDVDAAARKLESLGGSVQKAPQDIPGVGRFAVVADPHGAVFNIMTPLPRDEVQPHPARGAPGYAGWRELMAGNLAADWPFYVEMFGWAQTGEHDMGPMGVYRLFGNQDGEVGGMMTRPEQMPVSAWAYYFEVDDIHAAARRVAEAGGQVRNGPMEAPDGSWVLQGADPQGAAFGLVSTRR